MNEDFDLEKMERFYPLTTKAQELKLAIIHNYINHYTDDGKFYKLEGLIKYSDTNIYIYYKRKNSDENVFRFVFLINSNQKDTCLFMIHKLKQYKVQDFYANSNITTTERKN